MKVTHDDVIKVAKNSMLYIEEDQIETIAEEMSQILTFADAIQEVNTDGIDSDNIHGLSNVLREDVVVPSLPREDALCNAESQDEGYFLVKKQQRA